MQHRYLRKVEKSQTLLLNEQSRRLESGGAQVYKMGFGQSPFLPPPGVVASLASHAGRKDYSPVQGIPELRRAVAAFHAHFDGLDYKADNILAAPGSKLLIYAALASFSKADVFVPVPSWVSYIPQSELAGHTVIKVQTTYEARWRLTPELLDRAVARKADMSVPSVLILNYPGNPDGLTYDDHELRALADIVQKHNILVISDEIYGLLNHKGAHRSIAHYCYDNTIITSGLSKWCGAGGWRLGVALLPEALEGAFKETMLGVASETYSCATLPVQLAGCEAYRPVAAIEDYIRHQRAVLAALGHACQTRLHDAGVKVHVPQGGFYLFLDFTGACKRTFATSDVLCRELLADTGVALLPGTAFGMEAGHLSARLAYVDFDGDAALAASMARGLDVAIDDTFLLRQCPDVLAGIDRICGWV